MPTDFTSTDYFTDPSLVADPHPYFSQLRSQGPVTRLPAHNVVAVTGYDTAVRVWLDPDTFSACNAVTGPLPPPPFTPQGEDITRQIEANRPRMPFGEELLTLDPPRHTPLRSLIMRLFTPRRLREVEDYISGLADRLIDGLGGRCELYGDYAEPFSALVIADLLGVPEEDRGLFHKDPEKSPSRVGDAASGDIYNPLEQRRELFLHYVESRRRQPQTDILSELANARYPDGSIPEPMDVVRAASLLFGAGQDTTAHLLTTSLRILAGDRDLQARLREEPGLIPEFIEEVLRFDGPVKATFRLARTPATLAGEEVAPATTVMLATAALNRDPLHFEEPDRFIPGRRGGNQHLAFGRGIHMCPGASLARAEARISLERLLARFEEIQIDEETHGPAGGRHFDYAPTYIFRALRALHLRLRPAAR